MEYETTPKLTVTTEILSDDEFLESLPVAQRALVKERAEKDGISYYEALDVLVTEEAGENIADRSRQHSA